MSSAKHRRDPNVADQLFDAVRPWSAPTPIVLRAGGASLPRLDLEKIAETLEVVDPAGVGPMPAMRAGQPCATTTPMAEVGVRAPERDAFALVAGAAGGETITIIDRGRPVARLVPMPSSPLHSLLAAGLARAARPDISALSAPSAGAALTNELAAVRDAERS